MSKSFKKLMTIILSITVTLAFSSIAAFADDTATETELTVINNVKMFKPGSKATLKTSGDQNLLTLNMESDSFTKVLAKTYDAEKDEYGEKEIELGENNVFADIPIVALGETVVLQFWSKNNSQYYPRDLVIDLDNKTATFDPHKATIEEFEGLDMDEAVALAKSDANVNLLNDLIEAIQIQYRDETTDIYCAAAKACWDALSAEDKLEDDGYFSDDTGDASLDDPLNAAPDKEKELLVVSFGTSFNGSRVATIGAVEKALAKAYGSDYAVRRAFTAQIIINHIQSRDGEKIDNVEQAMDKAVDAGVKEMIVQPTHLMSGAEYDELKGQIDKYSDKINIRYAKPLLDSDADKETVAKAAVDTAVKEAGFATLAAAEEDGTAFVFMGHGTSHEANVTYTYMQQTMDKLGYNNCFVGTVEGKPAETALPEIKKAVEAKGFKKVVLRPLMVVAGDHANNDMASEEEGSWYYAFVNGGEFEVEGQDEAVDIGTGFGAENVNCQVNGLGEITTIQDLYIAHTLEVMKEVDPEAAAKAETAIAKDNASAELDREYSSDALNAEENAAIAEALADAKKAIEEATTAEAVEAAKAAAKEKIDGILATESEDVNVYYDKDGVETLLGMFRVMKYRSSVVGKDNGKLEVTITNKSMSRQYERMAFVAGDKTDEEKNAAAFAGKKVGPDASGNYQTSFTFEVDPTDVEKDLYISFETTSKGTTSWGTNATYRVRIHNTEAVQAEVKAAAEKKAAADKAAAEAAAAKAKASKIKAAKAVKVTIKKPAKGKKAFTAKWKNVKKVTGYRVAYSLKKNFKGVKYKKVKGAAKKSLKIKKLKAKKTYYVKVQAYTVIDGKTYYGKWSKVKKVKTKK